MEDKKLEALEEQEQIITLEFDDGTVECNVLGLFDYDGQEYIALDALDGTEDVYIYGYEEVGDDEFELKDIDDDALFEKVVDEFNKIMEEIAGSEE